ncbi:MAG: glutamate-1-semialdehyde 2,1-aminomutase [Rhabdochlamydiaceae bacterium]|nr:glutamate-1-semialdehyde 2,1-aminomutase [Rhabdochlamydiaceae bacterium]
MKLRPLTDELFRESCKRMPGGVSSPVRAFSGLNMTPLMVASGKADSVLDVDGHSYIDYCGAWGSLILGHSPPAVVHAAGEQIARGSSFGIATPYENAFAAKIMRHFPSMEKIRFVSSGTEAGMTVVRLARGFTGRSLIVKFNGHYHGHCDSLLIQAGSGVVHLPQASSQGVPHELIQHTVSLPFNDTDTCRRFLREHPDVAAVLVEPVAGNMGVVPAEKEFLQMLREETARSSALLIFDEVITGFRVSLNGAQGLYGITPDLTCLSKIIGGGFPAGAFGGRKEIMDTLAPLGSVYQAGTLSGNPVAMAAGYATITALEQSGFYSVLEEKTRSLTDPIEEFIRTHQLNLCLNRVGSMFTLFFGVRQVKRKEDLHSLDLEQFQSFFHFLFERGIYISPSAYEASFVSSSHTQQHLIYTRDAILEFLKREYSR